ncbi:MAG: hypothetical protein CMJ75_08640 [Planctomycetaceae bacterium]|nr:hypothetical protein [Planctomycetaceae bacterium]
MAKTRCTLFIGLTILTQLTAASRAAAEPLLERDILPLLARHCLGCHGGLVKEGELDLRTLPAMLRGGETGPAIIAGHAAKSTLWQRVVRDEMPAGDEREKLSAEEKATLQRWIDDGLPTVSERQQDVDPLLPAGTQHAPQMVSKAIDQHLSDLLSAAKLQPSPRATDAAFLRRVYLDLTGHVPNAEQATAFLDRDDPQRRARLIDTLLMTPDFGEQFGRTWRDWVMPPELPSTGNAGGQPHAEAKAFGSWLGKKFVANVPWDEITRDILTVQGETKSHPQVIFFGLVGQGGQTTADGSARAAASLFMGVQLQCARCHDDPYRDWSQQEHWALAAFFGRSQGDFKKIEIGKGPSKKPGEIVIPGDAFKNAGTTVLTSFLRGADFSAKGDKDLRQSFVDWLVAKENPYFARSFVNRLWFYLFSRGIVNPIDDLRELNPPSHPGLLKLLTQEFVASHYNVKHLFRCICNSLAYQRTTWIEPATDELERDALTTAFGRMPLRVMTADMLYDSLKQVYGDSSLDLRTNVEHTTVGMSAAVADPHLEFQRRFGTNEEDATDFTHGVAQMLTLLNHPRLLGGSQAVDNYWMNLPPPSERQLQLIVKIERQIRWPHSEKPAPEEARPKPIILAAINPKRNEDPFAAIKAQFVRFTIEQGSQSCLDELEVYGPNSPLNLALSASGAMATASSLLPGYPIHQVAHLNDGLHGNAHSWISNEDGGWAQIKLASAQTINRVVWGRDREGRYQDRLAQQYRIEVSLDGTTWTKVSDAARRGPNQKSEPPHIVLTRVKALQMIDWLYLSTLSRRPTEEEAKEALAYTAKTIDGRKALAGVLWMLINRSEFLLVR